MKNLALMACILIIIGCSTTPVIDNNIERAKEFAVSSSDEIADDIAFILTSMTESTEWYDFIEEDIDPALFSEEIVNLIEGMHYDECEYTGSTDSSEYIGWINSGLLKCYKPGTRTEIGAHWFEYVPKVRNNMVDSGQVSFDIMVSDSIVIYYSANPTPEYRCNNFECIPRTYME